MRYISTRSNHKPVGAAHAINHGIAPGGGLFVAESIPRIDIDDIASESYQQSAIRILTPLLSDFSANEIQQCVRNAYNLDTFDIESVIEINPLDDRQSVLELWHGPTAAFKDIALQLMPHLMAIAKSKVQNRTHTVILTATSGDTGKAALEGFKDCPGISIIVFFPDQGVSEIQKLQMMTTDGANTSVAAVRGNFDDCQTGVKRLFCDDALREHLASRGYSFSSANSINWGRLCPQIVYYFRAYATLRGRGLIGNGEPVNFCIPTGNFGNILAAYYAREMGLPINRLICASNENNILADFFTTGNYDINREFYRTSSPSMDILISSNLERFLFAITGHDGAQISQWYASLAEHGRFCVGDKIRARMNELIVPAWVNEAGVEEAIRETWRRRRYVIDTHTAVAVAAASEADVGDCCTVIDSTASPYKFSRIVLKAISGEYIEDEFSCVRRLHALTGLPVHRAVNNLQEKALRHGRVIEIDEMKKYVTNLLRVSAAR